MDESRVRESEMAEWHRLQGDALRPGSGGAETRRRDGPGRRRDGPQVASSGCRAMSVARHRLPPDHTRPHRHFSDLLRFSQIFSGSSIPMTIL